jgi:hypothetical protein
MRIFWALLSVLIAGGVLFVMLPASSGGGGAARPSQQTAPAQQTAPKADATTATASTLARPAEPTAAPVATVPAVSPAAKADEAQVPARPEQGEVAPVAAAPATVQHGSEEPKAPASAATASTSALASPANATTAAASPTSQPAAQIVLPGSDSPFEQAIGAGGDPVTLAEHAVFKGDKSIPSKALRKPDGSLLIDGRFVVTGAGTAAEPYVVPWDMIVSAQETFKPRLGMSKLPQRVTMLDGKHVKIAGFVAFPLTATSPKEVLVMLNQWDGCCIGTPPTPYDAVEVKLAAPATAGQKVMTAGAVTGLFRVDPYEDGGWLLGLYLMEDAKLSGTEGL